MTARTALLILLTACTQRPLADAGSDASLPADAGEPSDAGQNGGQMDAGDPRDRFMPPPDWLDGGGTLALLGSWEAPFRSLGPCYVTARGRLFFGSESPTRPGFGEWVFSTKNDTVWIGRTDIGVRPVLADESFAWCEGSLPAPLLCRRQLSDGGVIFAPPDAFSLVSWTASGFISADARKPNGEVRRTVWSPDGGKWEYRNASPVMSESGLGTGQLQFSDGGKHAFIWEAGNLISLEDPNTTNSSWGAAVNSKGLVVGERFEGGGNKLAVFWGGESLTVRARRGFGGEFFDVNENGLAVGQERTPGRPGWAVVWYRGRSWVVDEFADAGAGCSYTESQSVNDRNQIAVIKECPSAPLLRRCVLMDLQISD